MKPRKDLRKMVDAKECTTREILDAVDYLNKKYNPSESSILWMQYQIPGGMATFTTRAETTQKIETFFERLQQEQKFEAGIAQYEQGSKKYFYISDPNLLKTIIEEAKQMKLESRPQADDSKHQTKVEPQSTIKRHP